MITTEKDFNKLKNIIKKEKEIKIFYSEDDELNRKVIEKLPIKVLSISLENRKDFLKQKNSGLNQVLAKIMKKKEIRLGIFIDELVESREKEKILGRLKQNIFLCKKENLNFSFIEQKNKKSIQELKALLSVLKAPTKMTSKIEIIKEE